MTVSKIQKTKAIHNYLLELGTSDVAVVTVSKIQKTKAIHNTADQWAANNSAVVTVSKIQKTKAIHNKCRRILSFRFCCCDGVKDTKNESHSQQPADAGRAAESCCDGVKDTKNESHSQHC